MTREPRILKGKKIIYSINGSEKRIFTYKRMKSNTYLTLFIKINLKCVKDLNRRHETINLLEENLGEKKLFDINLMIFCVCVCVCAEAQATEGKVNQWYHIKPKSFCIAKDIVNKVKRQPTE